MEVNSPGFCYMTIYEPSGSRQRNCLQRQWGTQPGVCSDSLSSGGEGDTSGRTNM